MTSFSRGLGRLLSLLLPFSLLVAAELSGCAGVQLPTGGTPGPSPAPVRAVAAGRDHVLAATAQGAVWAWGDNGSGQLGPGVSGSLSTRPARVEGLPPAAAVAAGEAHSVALGEDGTVWAWGSNEKGQLGAGPAGASPTPRRVQGVGAAVAVATGPAWTVALQADGTARWWGTLGPDTRPEPQPVLGLEGAVGVAAGEGFGVALKKDGTVWAWGPRGPPLVPKGPEGGPAGAVQVPGLSVVQAVAAGSSHALALREDGTVWGWGWTKAGELGRSSNDAVAVPLRLPGLERATAVAAGDDLSAAVSWDGSILLWGRNDRLRLGSHENPSSRSTQKLDTGGFAALAIGSRSVSALAADGSVRSWGANDKGQLGDGSVFAVREPMKVSGVEGAIKISAGAAHTAALLGDGTIWSWGAGTGGPGGKNCVPPGPLPGAGDAVAVAAGAGYTLALRRDGSVWTWGRSAARFGSSGEYRYSDEPLQVPTLSPAVQVSASATHAAALLRDGSVWSWGTNEWGELGTGDWKPSAEPKRVVGLPEAVAVSAGGNTIYGHTLALTRDGGVWAWGAGSYYALGDGRSEKSAIPLRVAGLPAAVAVEAGASAVGVLTERREVWTWGDLGRSKDHSAQYVRRPLPVPGLPPTEAVAGGDQFGLALDGNGTVSSWGRADPGNPEGGAAVDLGEPPRRAPGLGGVKALAAGDRHAVALLGDGSVWTWGANDDCQLGILARKSSASPVRAVGIGE